MTFMKVLSNPHTHSDFVDGKNTLDEMARSAFQAGFTALGFSEHAHQTLDGRCGMVAEDEGKYIAEVKRLQGEYAGKMRIWLGTERDRLSDVDVHGYEYFIGANHYFVTPDGDVAGVDGGAEQLEAWVNRNLGGNWDKALERYFREYADYIEALPPDIIAHFDLIVKNNRKHHWFDEDSDAFLNPAKAAMDRMIRVCDVLEVNTGGTARSDQPVPYPVPKLLAYWHDLGGRVIPSSDCHRAHQITAWFDRIPDYLRDAGFDSMLTLGTGEKLFETVKLND